MRALLFSMMIPAVSFSQEVETLVIRRELQEKDLFPFIDGIYEGEIPVEKLGDPQGICNSAGWKVVSFAISYAYGRSNKTVLLAGAQVPDSIIREICANSLGSMIFITEIKAVNPSGGIVHLMPMNLIPFKHEE